MPRSEPPTQPKPEGFDLLPDTKPAAPAPAAQSKGTVTLSDVVKGTAPKTTPTVKPAGQRESQIEFERRSLVESYEVAIRAMQESVRRLNQQIESAQALVRNVRKTMKAGG